MVPSLFQSFSVGKGADLTRYDPFEFVPTKIKGYRSRLGFSFGVLCISTFLLWLIVIIIQYATAYANTSSAAIERDMGHVVGPSHLLDKHFKFSVNLGCANGAVCDPKWWRVRFRQRYYFNGSVLQQVSNDILPETCTIYSNEGTAVFDTIDSRCLPISPSGTNATRGGYPQLQGTFGDPVYAFAQADVFYTVGWPNGSKMEDTTMRVNMGYDQLYVNDLQVRDQVLRKGYSLAGYRFESTPNLRVKVDFFMLPRKISRESSFMNMDYFAESFRDIIFEKHVAVYDEAFINSYPNITLENGTVIRGTEYQIGTFYWRLSDRIELIEIQPYFTLWTIISNAGAAIALTAFFFGVPARAINRALFYRSLSEAVEEGHIEKPTNKSFSSNVNEVNAILKRLETLEREKKLQRIDSKLNVGGTPGSSQTGQTPVKKSASFRRFFSGNGAAGRRLNSRRSTDNGILSPTRMGLKVGFAEDKAPQPLSPGVNGLRTIADDFMKPDSFPPSPTAERQLAAELDRMGDGGYRSSNSDEERDQLSQLELMSPIVKKDVRNMPIPSGAPVDFGLGSHVIDHFSDEEDEEGAHPRPNDVILPVAPSDNDADREDLPKLALKLKRTQSKGNHNGKGPASTYAAAVQSAPSPLPR